MTQPDASSRVPWPPILYAGSAAVATVLTFLVPLPFLPVAGGWLFRIGGMALVGCGVAAGMAAATRFVRAGTPIPPTRPTRAVVTHGIYRYSRNPMYLGFTIVLGALGLAANSLWFVLAAPIAVAAVTKLAIEREERYLEAKFGETYRAYKRQVRRWL